MSAESLDILSIGAHVKKTNSSDAKVTTNDKDKGGPSLFDSLLNDAKNDQTKESKGAEESTKKGIESKEEVTKIDTKIKVDKFNSTQEELKETSKEVAKKLVDIVVTKVKNKKTEDSDTKSTKIENKKTKNSDTKSTKIENKKTEDSDTKSSQLKKIIKDNNIKNTDKENKNIEVKNSDLKGIIPVEEEKDKILKTKVIEIKKTPTHKIDFEDTMPTNEEKEKTLKTKIIEIKKTPTHKVDSKNIASMKEENDKTLKTKVVETKNTKIQKSDSTNNIIVIKDDSSKINNKNIQIDDIDLAIKSETSLEYEKENTKNNKLADNPIVDIIQNEKKIPQPVKLDIHISNDTIEEIKINRTIKESKISDIVKSEITQTKETLKEPLLANIFLSSQKKLKERVSMEQVTNAKKNLEENKTVKSVKQSATMLDLNIDEVKLELDQEKNKIGIRANTTIEVESKEIKKDIPSTLNNNRVLNKMMLEKQILSQNMNSDIIIEKSKTTQILETEDNSKTKKEITVTVTVPTPIIETIQNKIIGAQQKVGSFMSEVARSMYLNYKPPLTAFRMNLNPANLGSISIMMKSNKADNSLNISMNMSNSSTMEIFADNRGSLQSALAKHLNENSDISLNFGMQGDSSNGNFNNPNQNNNKNQNEDTIVGDIANTEIQEAIEEENTNYM